MNEKTTIGKFRKKPVVVEAIQFTMKKEKNYSNITEITNFTNNKAIFVSKNGEPVCYIPTLEGEMFANINSWIIKGIKGEFYPCKPDIFEQTYEKVEEKNGPK